MRAVNILLFLLLITSFAFATDNNLHGSYQLKTGSEELNIPEILPENSFNNELDIFGDTTIVGNTYYDLQAGGTVGRMITVEEEENGDQTVAIVWMRTADEGNDATRHIRLNRVLHSADGSTLLNQTGGWRVDTQGKAGYPVIAYYPDLTHVTLGDLFTPVYHSQQSPSDPWVNTYADELDLITGVFSTFSLSDDYPIANGCVWPKAAMDSQGNLHMIATEIRVGNTDEQTILYYKIPHDNLDDPSEVVPQIITSHGMNLSGEIAVSEDGNTVVIGQTVSRDYVIHGYGPDEATQGNNDIYLFISYDGGTTFEDPWNVTNFAEPDFSLLPDTTAANTDTLRAYTDMNIIFDNDDNIHLAFTAHNFKYITASNRAASYVMSTIYHWDSNTQFFCRAADGNFFTRNPGAWQSMVLNPNMYHDPESNVLYMAFQQYGSPGDTLDIGDNGMPNGDIMLTASTPHTQYFGLLWANPVNITETAISNSGAAGDCNNERDVSISLYNPGEYLNLSYLLDKHSGCVVMEDDGAVFSNNYMIYHRVHKQDLINEFDSWLVNTPMHVNGDGFYEDFYNWEFEPYGFERIVSVDEDNSSLPNGFELEQNYPNPFNPSTNISFTLQTPGSVKLAVFDIQGREVASLINRYMTAGSHQIIFNAEEFASGVYFLKLEQLGKTQTRKMLLVK